MKYLPLFLLLSTLPANAITWKEFWEPFEPRVHYRSSYTPMCNRVVYREEYIAGNPWRPGYVRHWRETVRVPCLSNY